MNVVRRALQTLLLTIEQLQSLQEGVKGGRRVRT